MAPLQQPKTQAFDVSAPASSSPVAAITDGSSIVRITLSNLIQYLGNSSYQVIMKPKQSFQDVMGVGSLKLGDVSVPINPVGPQLTQVPCLFLPGFVKDDAFVQALAMYDKVKSLDYDTYMDFLNILTGTRRLKMIINEHNPAPNFLRVAEHRATFHYRGVPKVCRRRNLHVLSQS